MVSKSEDYRKEGGLLGMVQDLFPGIIEGIGIGGGEKKGVDLNPIEEGNVCETILNRNEKDAQLCMDGGGQPRGDYCQCWKEGENVSTYCIRVGGTYIVEKMSMGGTFFNYRCELDEQRGANKCEENGGHFVSTGKNKDGLMKAECRHWDEALTGLTNCPRDAWDEDKGYHDYLNNCWDGGGTPGIVEIDGDGRSICMCVDEGSAKDTCQYLNSELSLTHTIRCGNEANIFKYDSWGNCEITISSNQFFKPNEFAIYDNSVIIRTRSGEYIDNSLPIGVYGWELERCKAYRFDLTCKLNSDNLKDEDIEEIYVCDNTGCCFNLLKNEKGGPVRNLTAGCPAPNDISFKKFKAEQGGWYSFDLLNKQPWDIDIFYGDLHKGNGDFWHKYECTIDPGNEYRMDCGSAPGEPVNGTASGTGSLLFDPEVFGASCTTKLEIPTDFGIAPIKSEGGGSSGGGCPSGQSMCNGSCCSIGHCSNGGCY